MLAIDLKTLGDDCAPPVVPGSYVQESTAAALPIAPDVAGPSLISEGQSKEPPPVQSAVTLHRAAPALQRPRSSRLPSVGIAFSGFAHAAVVAALVVTFNSVRNFSVSEQNSIEISVVSSVPQPKSVSLPPPAAPPQLPASLLPAPKLPQPEQPVSLSADLLPAPDLPAPPPPGQLTAALLPQPKVVLPPPPPDPADILAAAVAPLPPETKKPPPWPDKPRTKTVSRKPHADDAQQRKEQAKQRRLKRTRQRQQAALRQRQAELARRVAQSKARLQARHQARKEAKIQAAKQAAKKAQQEARVRARQQQRSASRSAAAGRRGSGGSKMSPGAYRGLVAARLRRNMPSGDVALIGQGTAVVRFSIASSGAATGIRLARSTGHRALDRAALATVRRSSPFPPPPQGASRSFRVPVRFKR